MTLSSHGSLENEIMNAVWTLEETSESDENVNISVADVVEFINKNSASKKAYTTVKTVMDRLTEKEYLQRIKSGKKFYYTSTSSRSERASSAIKRLAGQYFNNDMQSFMKALEKECLKN
ncbi:MAG: BlaI/MecI/CopY family transcriptional regulator [Candidatus Gastranaerophilales bacterium]|nr:BlaI/MecI/CopY family transcriptional regulator [Candidatus Gastranaerophilales bacterium]